MNCLRFIGIIAAVLSLAAVATGETDEQYHEWMLQSQAHLAASLENVETDPQRVAEAARGLQETFKQVEAFWLQRDAPLAQRFASSLLEGAAAVEKAASEGDTGELNRLLASRVRINCIRCHKAYRERSPEGGYRIKTPDPGR